MTLTGRLRISGWWLTLVAITVTALIYWPGLSGAYLFDDYPNIVDNHGVQPSDASLPSLVGAALSSPASEFKRPLSSLSFAANYLTTGLDPFWMKLTNLVIHLINGLLVFILARRLLATAPSSIETNSSGSALEAVQKRNSSRQSSITAALIAAGWLFLPINLTSVLYVVQRMESLANLFVLLGLLGYVTGRQRMLAGAGRPGFWLCVTSVIVPTATGLLAKETAVMLPLYALLTEWILFRFNLPHQQPENCHRKDLRIVTLFVIALILPLIVGLIWLLPGLVRPEAWAGRSFTLSTRLLSEARIVVDYIGWTLVPTPQVLSFYHDDFRVSTSLLTPWTTLASLIALIGLAALVFWWRARQPVAALGIALFLAGQLLTATILPLELIYEHRNYFASLGLLLTLVPLLAAVPPERTILAATSASDATSSNETAPILVLPRQALLVCLTLLWIAMTALTAQSWSNPLALAQELAARAPHSPRAQYELGRTYIIYSHYDPASPFTQLAYAPLERAIALPGSSILPQQALIFMNSHMHLPVKDSWWNSMIGQLKNLRPGVQDESSLAALVQCVREHRCDLPRERMLEALTAAVSHPNPSARLLSTYADYAWNVLNDYPFGLSLTQQAITSNPSEPAYRITEIRMLIATGRNDQANQALEQLAHLNLGGRLNNTLQELHTQLDRR
ncbi:hypothetical protein SAMN05216570_2069 [Dyella sp. OK004]|uniref:hypothetical protein n=1 Tax=Dyella sp. OK004 TaxID=1855292 RepID=UPI0008EB9CBC|nr:hypothetical protein [Dyella sp. OK004]SFS05835.1 hypothetical protein SAMN05216570_2069 [Dyella sp. OK004]